MILRYYSSTENLTLASWQQGPALCVLGKNHMRPSHSYFSISQNGLHPYITERQKMDYSCNSLPENCTEEISMLFYIKRFPFLSYSHSQMVTEKRNLISWTTAPNTLNKEGKVTYAPFFSKETNLWAPTCLFPLTDTYSNLQVSKIECF